jgi:hypothetical protein
MVNCLCDRSKKPSEGDWKARSKETFRTLRSYSRRLRSFSVNISSVSKLTLKDWELGGHEMYPPENMCRRTVLTSR